MIQNVRSSGPAGTKRDMEPKTILGIETSCDETSAAVLTGRNVRSNIISSQEVHKRYGGVVPELASRAHLEMIIPVVESAMRDARCTFDDLNAIAVTTEPGLLGALLVGETFAKALALSRALPLVPINHLEAHMFSGFLERPDIVFPFVALVVSGGHTMLVHVRDTDDYALLGTTQDDAAGEAFDKVAKLLGLGYPGGPVIDKLAKEGDPEAVALPRPLMMEPNYDFSFSGVKTSVLGLVRTNRVPSIPDMCASFQRAVVDVLAAKTIRAAHELRVRDVVVAGGVSANSELRATLDRLCTERGMRLTVPRLAYCTDNAAMVANLASFKLAKGTPVRMPVTASPTSTLLPFTL